MNILILWANCLKMDMRVSCRKMILKGRTSNTWYQAHFNVNTSGKFRVVFDCAARYKNKNLNDFSVSGRCMRNSLVL